VQNAIADSLITAVNYSQVLEKTIERGGTGNAAASVHGLSIPTLDQEI
jgi:hypothetical protein